MKRWRAVSLLAFFFAAVLWLHESSAQTPIFNGFYLVDKTGNELTISDDGALRTSTNVKHISGALHIAGIAQTINVNCLSGCSGAPGAAHTAVTQAGAWTVAHVTSVTHVVGTVVLRSMAGTAVTVTGTALDVNCTGCSAASAVNVGHISAAVHVAGIATVVTANSRTQAGDGTTIGSGGTGTGLTVTCTNCGGSVTPVTYFWQTPDAVGGANKLHADFFNASGSGKTIKILGVYPVVKTDAAVTGALALRFDLYRTSAVGTGGTAAQYKSATIDVAGGNITPRDTTNAALPAQVTARHLPTGGATISEWLKRHACFSEETNAGTHICQGQTEVLYGVAAPTGQQYLTLREGQGLLIKQGAVASVNNIGFGILFSVE